MRKIAWTIAVLLLLGLAAGCGNETAEEAAGEPPAVDAEPRAGEARGEDPEFADDFESGTLDKWTTSDEIEDEEAGADPDG